ncbi:Self-incomp_S1 domain-containing protein, partial [Cephalotus follicularis]
FRISTKSNFILLVLLFSNVFLGEAFYSLKLHKINVTVNNIVQSNVSIHCMSKDDDLWVHVLSRGDSFGQCFIVNFWITTLFFCGFTSQYGNGLYDIVKAQRDIERCSREWCAWLLLNIP